MGIYGAHTQRAVEDVRRKGYMRSMNDLEAGIAQAKDTAEKIVDQMAEKAKVSAEGLVDAVASSGKQVSAVVIDAVAERTKGAASKVIDKTVELGQVLASKAQDTAGSLADKAHDVVGGVTAKITGSGGSQVDAESPDTLALASGS